MKFQILEYVSFNLMRELDSNCIGVVFIRIEFSLPFIDEMFCLHMFYSLIDIRKQYMKYTEMPSEIKVK